jgi:hypothetical protein
MTGLKAPGVLQPSRRHHRTWTSSLLPVGSCQWALASGLLPVGSCQWALASGLLPVGSCQWAAGARPACRCAGCTACSRGSPAPPRPRRAARGAAIRLRIASAPALGTTSAGMGCPPRSSRRRRCAPCRRACPKCWPRGCGRSLPTSPPRSGATGWGWSQAPCSPLVGGRSRRRCASWVWTRRRAFLSTTACSARGAGPRAPSHTGCCCCLSPSWCRTGRLWLALTIPSSVAGARRSGHGGSTATRSAPATATSSRPAACDGSA